VEGLLPLQSFAHGSTSRTYGDGDGATSSKTTMQVGTTIRRIRTLLTTTPPPGSSEAMAYLCRLLRTDYPLVAETSTPPLPLVTPVSSSSQQQYGTLSVVGQLIRVACGDTPIANIIGEDDGDESRCDRLDATFTLKLLLHTMCLLYHRSNNDSSNRRKMERPGSTTTEEADTTTDMGGGGIGGWDDDHYRRRRSGDGDDDDDDDGGGLSSCCRGSSYDNLATLVRSVVWNSWDDDHYRRRRSGDGDDDDGGGLSSCCKGSSYDNLATSIIVEEEEEEDKLPIFDGNTCSNSISIASREAIVDAVDRRDQFIIDQIIVPSTPHQEPGMMPIGILCI